MWLLADMVSTGMMLAGVALLILILLRRSYRYYGRKGPSKKEAAAYLTRTARPATDGRSLSTAPAEVLRWQVEMHEIARDMKAELDTKMRALQVLIRQARDESDRLQQIVHQATLSGREERRCQPVPGSSAAAPRGQSRVYELADEGCSASEIARRIGMPLGEVELILSLRSRRDL